jgi:hypothetical protein
MSDMGGQDELEALRRRAYGPAADIDRDPGAIERLRALEEAERPQPPVVYEAPPEPAPPPLPEAIADEHENEPEPHPPLYRAALAVVAALGRVRRPTWLIIAGLAALAAVLVTVLVVVQRVQTDPLRVGAVQVARLSVDPGFEVPELYFGGGSEREPQAFQQFHGLRTVLTARAFFGAGGGSLCLNVYSEDDVEITPNSFSGQILGGCAAGAFPATVQFNSDIDGFPEELFSAFPGDALQFVYDEKNNEVVVFADNG